MKYFVIALAMAALAGAQTPAVSIRPNNVSLGGDSASAIAGVGRPGVPILGYVAGPGPLDLREIVGTSQAAQLGEKLAVPSDVKRLFVPPREHFLLLESAAAKPLALWLPSKGAIAAEITGAMAHPETAVFSARGEAVVLYAKSGGRVQVMSGLPGQPVVAAEPELAQWGEAVNFAVSDDGAVVVVELAGGNAIFSIRGAGWRRLPGAYGALGMAFVPNTHNLVVSDSAQPGISMVEIAQNEQPARLLLDGIQADRLAFTKEGGQLLAASSSQGKLWTVDLQTTAVGATSSGVIGSLLPLRDGHTFLLSSAPALSLLNVAVESNGSVGFVPVKQ
jgi:hypothetical protein